MNPKLLQAMAVLLACWGAHAQVNSGSNGSDGAFNPTTSTVIDMADHPDGIYQYTSVNIPANVTVRFIPNANNTPVVWLVQSNVVISGRVDVSGQDAPSSGQGGQGGPGGFRGGNGGIAASAGQGPGGGAADAQGRGGTFVGNQFLVPLVGGSGGGGSTNAAGGGGGGGGGALLIAASGTIQFDGGSLYARGGGGAFVTYPGGGGSGGAIRLVATRITGWGSIDVRGGPSAYVPNYGSDGRVRFDTYEYDFGGRVTGAFSQGAQFVILPSAGQFALTIASVGGVPVAASPSGVLSIPDAVLSAQQNNPIPVVVHCSNIPLNTQITVHVKPANAPAVSATGRNSSGTLASSTATILINIPRGGGWIYATAATGN